MDFDPRDYDARDEERYGNDRDRGSRSGSDADREWDDWRPPEVAPRERDDNARELGRGPGDDSRHADSDKQGPDSRDDARWPHRERDGRERDFDPREMFTRHVNLPRGLERQLVWDRDREYTLRGSESRTLATVGAFRVVSSRDLRDHNGRPTDPRSADLRHLRGQGLVETVRVPGYREQAVTLTKEGRHLVTAYETEGLRAFVQRHADLLGALPGWTLRLVLPQQLADQAARFEGVVRDEPTPLRPKLLAELKWYFAKRRSTPNPQALSFEDPEFWERQAAFASPRFQQLYRRWLADGDTVFEALASPAIAEALERGTGRIESRVLLLSYRHLAPLVSLFRSCRKGVEGWDTSSAPSQPLRSTSPPTASESVRC